MFTGDHFLDPITVVLKGANGNEHFVTAHITSPVMLTVELPADLQVQEYQLLVVNGDQASVEAPGTLTVLGKRTACFYDEFESGTNQWQIDGQWGIIAYPDNSGHAITDSPTGNYNSAMLPADVLITTITSPWINLDTCEGPVLFFRQAYAIAQGTNHQDWGKVEIMTTNSLTWTTLVTVSGGSIYPSTIEASAAGDEWRSIPLTNVRHSLAGYSGDIRLRFQLEVDQNVADKGWIIDDVTVASCVTPDCPTDKQPEPQRTKLFLPIILK